MFKKWVDYWKKLRSGGTEEGSSPRREEPKADPERIREWRRMAEDHIIKHPDSTVYRGEQVELELREEGFVIRPREKEHQSDVWKQHSTHWRNFWLYDNKREIEFARVEEVKLNWDRGHPGGSLEIRYRDGGEDGSPPAGAGGSVPFRSWPQFFALREARSELERRIRRPQG